MIIFICLERFTVTHVPSALTRHTENPRVRDGHRRPGSRTNLEDHRLPEKILQTLKTSHPTAVDPEE